MWSLMVRGLTQVPTKHLFFALFGQTLHPQIQKTFSEDGENDPYVLCCGKVQELGWHWCSSLPDRSHPGITHGKHQCCFLRWLVCAHWEVTAKQLMVKAGTGTFGFIHTTSNCMVNIGIQKALWKITIITEKRTEHTLIFYLFMCIE